MGIWSGSSKMASSCRIGFAWQQGRSGLFCCMGTKYWQVRNAHNHLLWLPSGSLIVWFYFSIYCSMLIMQQMDWDSVVSCICFCFNGERKSKVKQFDINKLLNSDYSILITQAVWGNCCCHPQGNSTMASWIDPRYRWKALGGASCSALWSRRRGIDIDKIL